LKIFQLNKGIWQ